MKKKKRKILRDLRVIIYRTVNPSKVCVKAIGTETIFRDDILFNCD